MPKEKRNRRLRSSRTLSLASFLLVATLVLANLGNVESQASTTEKFLFTSYRDGNSEIYSMNTDGTEQTNLSNNSAIDTMAQWSRDGTKIFFISERNSPGISQIFSMNADGGGVQQLTDDGHRHTSLEVSPDGSKIKSIYIHSEGDSTFGIVLINTDGSNRVEVTDPYAAMDNSGSSWSSDSSKIVISRITMTYPPYEPTGTQLLEYNVEDQTSAIISSSESYPATEYTFGPVYSPDGSKIITGYLESPDPTNMELRTFRLNGEMSDYPIADTVTPYPSIRTWKPKWFGNSSSIFFSGYPKNIVDPGQAGVDIFSTDISPGSIPRNLTSDMGSSGKFNFGFWPHTNEGSSEAQQIIFNHASIQDDFLGPSGDSEIYLMNTDGSNKINLTNSPGTDFYTDFGGVNFYVPDEQPPLPPKTGRLAVAISITTIIISSVLLLARTYQKKYHNIPSTK